LNQGAVHGNHVGMGEDNISKKGELFKIAELRENTKYL
jgi:hypothetical protein